MSNVQLNRTCILVRGKKRKQSTNRN